MKGKELLGPAIVFFGIATAGAGYAIREGAPLPSIVENKKQPIGDILFIAGTATATSLTLAEAGLALAKRRQDKFTTKPPQT